MDLPTNDGQFVSFFAPTAARRHLQVDRRSRAAPVRGSTWRRSSLYTGPTIPGRHAARSRGRPARINTGIPPTPAGAAAAPRPAHAPRRQQRQRRRRRLPQRPAARRRRDRHRRSGGGRHPRRPTTFGTRIGDGVNVNDMPKRGDVPFVAAGSRRPQQPARRSRRAGLHGRLPAGPVGGCPEEGSTTMSFSHRPRGGGDGGERDGALRPAATPGAAANDLLASPAERKIGARAEEDRARPEALSRLQRAGPGAHPAGARDRRSASTTSAPRRPCARR